MAYTKQNFADGNILTAAELNAMDEQISANETAIDEKQDKLVPGEGITIAEDGKTISATAVDKKLVSIEVTTPPTKTMYRLGDIFDSMGMVVTATYEDGTSEVITGYTYAPSGALSGSIHAITVTYASGGTVKTAQVGIDVIVIYGFKVDGNESDPYEAITYLEDSVGKLDDYGYGACCDGGMYWANWEENEFFVPRPCMLKYDGTVDYYLDANNYLKKEDGTSSDVDNVDYAGNAMMEWGRDGQKIWYKIVTEDESGWSGYSNSSGNSCKGPTSYSVYFSNYQADEFYVCWNFYKNDESNEIADHFYTPIYPGYLDDEGRLRSISDVNFSTSAEFSSGDAAEAMMEAAKKNGDRWSIETWSDKTLIFLLLYLLGHSLDIQGCFGYGFCNESSTDCGTGSLDESGLFYGDYGESGHTKTFGMEDLWGNANRATAGLMIDKANDNLYYKMTYGTADESKSSGYSMTDWTGYKYLPYTFPENGYVKSQVPIGSGNVGYMLFPSETGGTSDTYYCDYFHTEDDAHVPLIGGTAYNNSWAGFYLRFDSVKYGDMCAAVCYK